MCGNVSQQTLHALLQDRPRLKCRVSNGDEIRYEMPVVGGTQPLGSSALPSLLPPAAVWHVSETVGH